MVKIVYCSLCKKNMEKHYHNPYHPENRFCWICGSKEKLNIHHIIPKKDGGLNDFTNVMCVCQKCHIEIHKKSKKDSIF